ncbi:MAG: NAD(P)/FAD-dependent oxidoreductase, partial [Gaiellaceae bacterium]
MQPTLTPWWLEEAPPDPEEAPLEENVEADVAIVGGGLTGLWTALALLQRDAGLRIVVLEAQRCGDGPSGRNGGFCHGYWPSLGRLSATVGTDGALVIASLSTGVYQAIADLGEDVWLDKAGMVTAATTSAQEASVASLVRTAREHGVPEQAVALDREELALRCRSPLFRSGVFFP